ncbi:MAG: hypothetical protein WAM60_16130 [Candidatus Promineifilaceae bacterium]
MGRNGVRLFSDRGKRAKWEEGLIWFRLRYLDPPTRAINLLSRPQAVGRVALYCRPGEPVSRLFIGIPQTHTRLLERMAADFDFSLTPTPSEFTIPLVQPMTAVDDLPWDTAFMAHIANECAFVSLENGGGHGPYLPQPPSTGEGRGAATWTLPASPPPGLTLKPSWNGRQTPAYLTGPKPKASDWPLGWSAAGVPLSVCGRVNLYGRQEAVADWLVEQVTQILAINHVNLVVIDGTGDLVPRLKRKRAVTRLLGKKLAYIDMAEPPLAGGFNPLAAAPAETEEALIGRWQRWFQGMNIPPQSIQLLSQARRDGVGDILALRKWLKQIGRLGQQAVPSTMLSRDHFGQAVSTLGLALNRLTADQTLREWLEWPVNRFEMLPEGALFFACQHSGWERQQLLRAALLAVMGVEGVRLVVHGFAWQGLANLERVVVSNSPLLPHSVKVLAGSGPVAAAKLAAKFLDGDPLLAETLEILPSYQAIFVNQGEKKLISWAKRGE